MSKTIQVALAGAGAFGIKHLDGIQNIDGVKVVSLIGREFAKTQEVANKYGIGHVTTDLADSLALPGDSFCGERGAVPRAERPELLEFGSGQPLRGGKLR